MIAQRTIDELVELTKGGYSYDRYSRYGWRGVIAFLQAQNLTDEQIVSVMLSKHLRWAADLSGQEYGDVNETAFVDYVKNDREFFTPVFLDDLVRQTRPFL